jgi:fatty acid desaturase
MPSGVQVRRWKLEEAATALYVWSIAALVGFGALPPRWLYHWLVIGAGILVVNQIRTLAAHGYQNRGEPMDARQQLLDSITLGGPQLQPLLIAPVGLRFHALHHVLPSLPYHNLGAVHRRLLRALPHDAVYRQTESAGLQDTLQTLWERAAAR